MSTKTTNDGKPSGQLTFSSHNLPALDDGLYEIKVEHRFKANSSSSATDVPVQTKHFAITGPRFSLESTEIAAQFPPPKTSGNYYNVLPHIMFKRAILPWERKLDSSKTTVPWLALILCSHDEIKDHSIKISTNTLEQICKDAQSNNIKFPKLTDITLIPGESPQQSVNYIDIPGALLQQILPTEEELPFLANVRQSVDSQFNENEPPKFSTLLSNRLPQEGQENTVFLISLENRKEVYDSVSDNTIYRLVVLNHWRFASVDQKLTFEQLLNDANHFADTTTTKGTLRLPTVGDSNADSFLEKGYVPLEHQTRQGNKMVSWYRGPLVPGLAASKTTSPKPSSITSPDDLVRVYSELGMFDVTYASAWNLGRSIMLENKRVAQALFEWKRACVHATKADVPHHLPNNKPVIPPPPDLVKEWFAQLGLLEQVPFNYLVVDERLLPQESIQFFSVDPHWLNILKCGAFAIGDIASGDEAIEDVLFEKLPASKELSGFLLRSKVVSGWPHLLINGFDVDPPKDPASFESGAPPLSQYRYSLGKDTMLCLFEGTIKYIEAYLHPEIIHFGVDYKSENPKDGYIKHLKESDKQVNIPIRPGTNGVIDIKGLKTSIEQATSMNISSAEFAYQMIEGVPKVRFTV